MPVTRHRIQAQPHCGRMAVLLRCTLNTIRSASIDGMRPEIRRTKYPGSKEVRKLVKAVRLPLCGILTALQNFVTTNFVDRQVPLRRSRYGEAMALWNEAARG